MGLPGIGDCFAEADAEEVRRWFNFDKLTFPLGLMLFSLAVANGSLMTLANLLVVLVGVLG